MSAKVVIGEVKGENVDGYFHECLTRLVLTRHELIEAVISVTSGPNLPPARDEVVRAFLETKAPWLFMVDTDMAFLPIILEQLLSAGHPTNAPIVGALCFKVGRDGAQQPTIYHDTPDGLVSMRLYPRKDLVPCDATGTGALLVHRKVFETMGDPWFALADQDPYWDLTEDLRFCIKARDEGFPIHVDTRVGVGHMKRQRMDEATYFAEKIRREMVRV